MEKNRVSMLMICLVLCVLVKQSTAALPNEVAFGICYGPCFFFCSTRPGTTSLECALKCFKSCLITDSTAEDSQSMCQFRCASAMCSNLSSKDDPATNEVESCVGGCSAQCANN